MNANAFTRAISAIAWVTHVTCGLAIIFAASLAVACASGTPAAAALAPTACALWQVALPSEVLRRVKARGYTSATIWRALGRFIWANENGEESRERARARERGFANAASRRGNESDGMDERRAECAIDSVVPRGRRRLPPVTTWPHRPVFVRASARTRTKTRDGWATKDGPKFVRDDPSARVRAVDANVPVNTETAMSFETELFVGKIVCRFKGVAASAGGTPETWFARKRCTFQVSVQGRFKECVRCDELFTGGEFYKPFINAPPRPLVYAGQQFFKALTPSLQIDMLADVPYYYAPLGSTLTVLAAHAADAAPEATDPDIDENTKRIGGPFARGVSVYERCRIMSDPKQSSALYFNTEDVYTFDYKQNVLLFDDYVLDVGFTKVDLAHHLDGQPLSFFAKQVRPGHPPRYAYSYEIWHEALLASASERTPVDAPWNTNDDDDDDDADANDS